MTNFRSEDALVGLIALAVVPWLVWRLRRGLVEGKLPIGRSHLLRDERPGAFRALFAVYVAAAALMGFIAADLLVGIDFRQAIGLG